MTLQTQPWIDQVVCGRYRVTSPLKEGGMASLYLAQDVRSRETVVVKTPRPTLLTEEFLRRFAREVRALTKLKHPHIVPILDAGDHQGLPFFVLKYMPKGTLRNRQPVDNTGRSRPVSLDSLVLWLGPIAAALDYLHSQNFIHRDVKPDNILFDADDVPYLCDFGILKAAAEETQDGFKTQLTSSGYSIGTPQYMAPELIAPDLFKGHKPDGRSDQYSLGATLYELLAGQTPIADTNIAQIMVKLLQKKSQPLETVLSGLPAELTQAVNRALSFKPSQRYPSCRAFAAAAMATVQQAPARKPTPEAMLVGLAYPTPDGLRATCPACGTAYNLPRTFLGQRWTCTNCQQRFAVQPCADSASATPVAVAVPTVPTRPGTSSKPASISRRPRPALETANRPSEGRSKAHRPNNYLAVAIAGIGVALLVLFLLVMIVGGSWWWYSSGSEPPRLANNQGPPPDLRVDREECEQQIRIGKGSAAYVQQAAPDRIAVWRSAAEQGSPEGQWLLARCLELGAGTEKNAAEAVAWCRKAADQGFALAQNNLGFYYASGTGVAKDDTAAVQWYRKAADQENALAQYNLAMCYTNGKGVTKDEVEAVRWFRKAAEQGNVLAQNELATCYENGVGVTKDEVAAVQWYRRAADQGFADAQENLGTLYEAGKGVAKDDTAAVQWYRKAADQGNALGQYNLGRCYALGTGVTQDDTEAVEWYRKSANQGYAFAQNNLGVMYITGRGVTKDEAEAVQWYRKAADQGMAIAQCNLAGCYANGWGVAKSPTEAVQWYRKSAAQGYAPAKEQLANFDPKGDSKDK